MRLQDVAKTIRSKNAGSFMITVEIIFDNADYYHYIKDNQLITRRTIAKAYALQEDQVTDFCYYDAGLGIKANFRRRMASGGPAETDVYGCQQYAPLLKLEFPEWVR